MVKPDHTQRIRSHDNWITVTKLAERQKGRKCLTVLQMPSLTHISITSSSPNSPIKIEPTYFKCELPSRHEGSHQETGIIKPARGTLSKYVVRWEDHPPIEWRTG